MSNLNEKMIIELQARSNNSELENTVLGLLLLEKEYQECGCIEDRDEICFACVEKLDVELKLANNVNQAVRKAIANYLGVTTLDIAEQYF